MEVPATGNTRVLIKVNVDVTGKHMVNSNFEDLYISVRQKEMRVLTDAQLIWLPDTAASAIYYKEWRVRKQSLERLVAYLSKKNKPLEILEIGCGNGWLAAKLSEDQRTHVIGLDINRVDINQAERVFRRKNLEFICGQFKPGMFKEIKFDIILFAASIQYFPSLNKILADALTCLARNGEIHIIDSPFYKSNEVQNAALRTENYYKDLGYPQMASYYFHHTLINLQQFNYKVLMRPVNLLNRFKIRPFYWIMINHGQLC